MELKIFVSAKPGTPAHRYLEAILKLALDILQIAGYEPIGGLFISSEETEGKNV